MIQAMVKSEKGLEKIEHLLANGKFQAYLLNSLKSGTNGNLPNLSQLRKFLPEDQFQERLANVVSAYYLAYQDLKSFILTSLKDASSTEQLEMLEPWVFALRSVNQQTYENIDILVEFLDNENQESMDISESLRKAQATSRKLDRIDIDVSELAAPEFDLTPDSVSELKGYSKVLFSIQEDLTRIERSNGLFGAAVRSRKENLEKLIYKKLDEVDRTVRKSNKLYLRDSNMFVRKIKTAQRLLFNLPSERSVRRFAEVYKNLDPDNFAHSVYLEQDTYNEPTVKNMNDLLTQFGEELKAAYSSKLSDLSDEKVKPYLNTQLADNLRTIEFTHDLLYGINSLGLLEVTRRNHHKFEQTVEALKQKYEMTQFYNKLIMSAEKVVGIVKDSGGLKAYFAGNDEAAY